MPITYDVIHKRILYRHEWGYPARTWEYLFDIGLIKFHDFIRCLNFCPGLNLGYFLLWVCVFVLCSIQLNGVMRCITNILQEDTEGTTEGANIARTNKAGGKCGRCLIRSDGKFWYSDNLNWISISYCLFYSLLSCTTKWSTFIMPVIVKLIKHT